MITDQRDNERLKKEPEVRFIYSEPPLFFCNLDNDNGWISQQQQETTASAEPKPLPALVTQTTWKYKSEIWKEIQFNF